MHKSTLYQNYFLTILRAFYGICHYKCTLKSSKCATLLSLGIAMKVTLSLLVLVLLEAYQPKGTLS